MWVAKSDDAWCPVTDTDFNMFNGFGMFPCLDMAKRRPNKYEVLM
jgi:hypothetical protein